MRLENEGTLPMFMPISGRVYETRTQENNNDWDLMCPSCGNMIALDFMIRESVSVKIDASGSFIATLPSESALIQKIKDSDIWHLAKCFHCNEDMYPGEIVEELHEDAGCMGCPICNNFEDAYEVENHCTNCIIQGCDDCTTCNTYFAREYYGLTKGDLKDGVGIPFSESEKYEFNGRIKNERQTSIFEGQTEKYVRGFSRARFIKNSR